MRRSLSIFESEMKKLFYERQDFEVCNDEIFFHFLEEFSHEISCYVKIMYVFSIKSTILWFSYHETFSDLKSSRNVDNSTTFNFWKLNHFFLLWVCSNVLIHHIKYQLKNVITVWTIITWLKMVQFSKSKVVKLSTFLELFKYKKLSWYEHQDNSTLYGTQHTWF